MYIIYSYTYEDTTFSCTTEDIHTRTFAQVKGDGSEETSGTPTKVILSNVSGKCEIGRLQDLALQPDSCGKTCSPTQTRMLPGMFIGAACGRVVG